MNLLLKQYEQTLYANYSNEALSTEEYKVFEAQSEHDLIGEIESMPKKMQNPFKSMNRWLKFEILDLEAIILTVSQKNEMEKRQTESINKRNDERTELKQILEGKEALKHLFMSKNDKINRIT